MGHLCLAGPALPAARLRERGPRALWIVCRGETGGRELYMTMACRRSTDDKDRASIDRSLRHMSQHSPVDGSMRVPCRRCSSLASVFARRLSSPRPPLRRRCRAAAAAAAISS